MPPASSASTTFAPSPRQAASAPARLVFLGVALLVIGIVFSDRSLDTPAFLWLQQVTEFVPPAFWAAWSVLGLGLCTALIAALVADKAMAPVATLLWSLLIGGIALQLFKHLWVVPRPMAVLPPESIHVIGLRLRAGSMPSGHAAMLTALGCALGREAWPRRRSLLPLLVVLVVLGCVARIAVGVHWPSDVLVGAGVGVLSVVAGDLIDARWSLRRWLSAPLGRQLFAVVQLVAAVVLLATDTGYPAALPVQWLLGVASIVSAAVRWRDAARAAGRDVASSRRLLTVSLAGVLAAVVLVALLRHADTAALRAAATALPSWAWFTAALGLFASYALRALRLQAEWGPRVGARFADCLHLLLLHNAAVNLLPLRAGEAGYPWLLRRRFGVGLADSSASLLRLRLQDLLVLGALAVALLVPHGPPLAIGLLAAAMIVRIAFAPVLARNAMPQEDDGRLQGVVRAALRAMLAPPSSPASARWNWAFAGANWIVKIAALGGLLAALAGVSLASGLRGALGGELAAVLPLQGPAGLGTYEAGAWAAVALHDRSALAQVGIAALAVHVFALVVGLLAAAAIHATSLGKVAPRTEGRTS